MTDAPAFIGVDWGTSNARFMLVNMAGHVLDEKAGDGISKFDGPDAIGAACLSIIAPWVRAHPQLPVIMAGMVGSNIGWRKTPYAPAPATIDNLMDESTHFTVDGIDFTIIAGVITTGPNDITDVMRGEETQIFGAISDQGNIYCLPGTHSKWVMLSDGKIEAFHTALTGELMQLLGEHSILLQPKRKISAADNVEFAAGVTVARNADMGLESLLFSVRSQQISGKLSPSLADSYLAGLAIGCEIKSALARSHISGPVQLIGAPQLTSIYNKALQIFDLQSNIIDGRAAVISGLTRIYRKLSA